MSEHSIMVRFEHGRQTRVAPGRTLRSILKQHPRLARGLPVSLGAVVNNELVSLQYRIETDSTVRLLSYRDSYGQRIYRNTLAFLLAKTVHERFPEIEFAVEQSLSKGLYYSFRRQGRAGISPAQRRRLEQGVRDLIRTDAEIERRKISFAAALEYFEKAGRKDKLNLLRFKNPSKVTVYQCGDYFDLAQTPLADRAGALVRFKLVPHGDGFVAFGPERSDPSRFPKFDPAPYLFDVFREHTEWGRTVHVRTVGDLNERIAEKTIDGFIDLNEAYQEKRIVLLANAIAQRRERVKWALIAGPSSSGKTTFSKRLAIQLQANGRLARPIALDSYFVERDRTPRDEDGQPDFEHLDALDLPLINEHLDALDRGREVELPYFNFHRGAREWRGEKMRLGPDDIVLLEGIHGLNPRLTAKIPAAHKFRIYISALTQLNLDSSNRIATTDNRLIRRLVRDNQFRGHRALKTLEMWPRVRRGEKNWVFPYQTEADVAFNSALDYELSVLRAYAEPLLAEVKPFHPQYAEARRLQQFLENFLIVPPDRVPPDSLLREFIGRGSFDY